MTAKIFRNAFLIGFTVLLACILLFFFIMYSNYQAQAYDILEVEAEHIAEGMQICGGKEYLAAMQSDERITWIAPDGSVLYDNMADADTMENHLQRPEVQEAFETGSGRLVAAGESVKAVIVLRQGFETSTRPEDIIAWAREHMAAYKYPREVEFVSALPRNASGKLMWRTVQAQQDAKDAGNTPTPT